jgi:putative SOS response-associated peptidase YedK
MIRDSETGMRVLRAMRWGLIPHWTKKEPDFGNLIKAMNARDESLITNNPMFNYSKKSHRCIVIADG